MMDIETIEKQFRDQLKDHESFDLDADLTWRAIETELNQQKKKWRSTYILLLAFVGLLGVFFVNEKHFSKSYHSIAPRGMTSQNEHEQSTTFDLSIQTGTGSPMINRWTMEPTTSSPQHSQTRQQYFNPTTKITPWLQYFASTTMLKKTDQLKKRTIKGHVLNPKVTTTKRKYATTAAIPAIPQQPLQSLTAPKAAEELNESHITPVVDNQPQYTLEAISRFFGMNNGLRTPENEYAMLRNQSETPQISWVLGVNLWRVKPSGWLLGFGLEYQNSAVQFRYQGIETETALLPDTLLQVLIDPQTQDTIARHFGEVELEQQQMRYVQHYNTFQTLNIPIQVGFVKSTAQKLRYGITGGLSFQYYIRQSGRLLAENGTIIDFSDNTFFRRIGLSAHIQPVLIFRRTGQWELSCNPFFAFSLSNRMKSGTAIAQHPFTYGLSLGIRKAL